MKCESLMRKISHFIHRHSESVFRTFALSEKTSSSASIDQRKINYRVQHTSTLVFENKLGYLKKLVHKPQHPLQQILRRLREEASLDLHESSCTLERSC